MKTKVVIAAILVSSLILAGCGSSTSDDGGESSLFEVAKAVVAGSPNSSAAGYSASSIPHLLYPAEALPSHNPSGNSLWYGRSESELGDGETHLPIAWLATTVLQMQYAVKFTITYEDTGRTVNYTCNGVACAKELFRTILDITFYNASTAAAAGTVRITGESEPLFVISTQGPSNTVYGELNYDDFINAMRPFVEQ